MRGYLWFAFGALLFFAWALSYIVFHVAGLLIHLLLVFGLMSVMFHAYFGYSISSSSEINRQDALPERNRNT